MDNPNREQQLEKLSTCFAETKDSKGAFIVDNFSVKCLIKNYLIKLNFAQISQELPRANISLVEFVEKILAKIQAEPEYRVYLVSAMISLFECICFEYGHKNSISFDSFTNYVLQNYKNTYPLSYKLKTHKNSKLQSMNHQPKSDLESLNFHSPIVIEESRTKYVNLDVMSLKTNAKTFKTPVKICNYDSEDRLFVIVLESISSIYLFDDQCNFVKNIIPNTVVKFKEVNIFSVGYSSSRKRVR